jgi:hypothetical protein
MIVTLEQARAMRWPFRNPRQPMGLLLDQGTIAAPDLQRASRTAYSPRFKAACLMLLHELVSTPNGPIVPIVRSVPALDQLPVRLLPNTCPICESKLQVNGGTWECVADRTHYWLHRVQHLRAARQKWIASLSPDERQYRAEIWQTACDLGEREQFLSEHALKYPAGS